MLVVENTLLWMIILKSSNMFIVPLGIVSQNFVILYRVFRVEVMQGKS